MKNRSPRKMQHLVDAVAEYARTFEAARRSDGSDLTAHLHQLVETIAGVNRAMHAGVFLAEYFERAIGPPLALATVPTDPAAEAQYRDDLARWVMQAWQIMCQLFLMPSIGSHPMLDALHNDADRGLAGDALQFFRAVAPKHGNKRGVFQYTARDAAVFTVILAVAELEGKDRYQRMLDSAGVGVSERNFTDMRQNVEDKTALARIVEEANRRRDNHRIRKEAGQASRPSRVAAPRPGKLMAAELIAGSSLTRAEQMALYPERYPDLAGLGLKERIRHLLSIWNGVGGKGAG
jgi:hypothetical protein